MCEICTSRTSMTRQAAEIEPEGIMCCECNTFYAPGMYKALIKTHKGRCTVCLHQMYVERPVTLRGRRPRINKLPFIN